jgi:hypothetical protein
MISAQDLFQKDAGYCDALVQKNKWEQLNVVPWFNRNRSDLEQLENSVYNRLSDF